MCNKCIHKPVCSKYIATGGVKSCEQHKEERKGVWEEADDGDGVVCSVCRTDFCTLFWKTEDFNYCPHCGADMRGEENG